MTEHAMTKIIFTQFLISQTVAVLSWLVMLVVGLIDIHEIEHMQSSLYIHHFFLFVFKTCYYCTDLETQWPRNPELKILPVFNRYQRG